MPCCSWDSRTYRGRPSHILIRISDTTFRPISCFTKEKFSSTHPCCLVLRTALCKPSWEAPLMSAIHSHLMSLYGLGYGRWKMSYLRWLARYMNITTWSKVNIKNLGPRRLMSLDLYSNFTLCFQNETIDMKLAVKVKHQLSWQVRHWH